MTAGGPSIEPHIWRVAAVVILGMTMSILDTTIVNVGLETLGREFDSPISQIQWVASGYLLALAAAIPVSGGAARRFGGKNVYLTVVALFTLGSALCGLASTSTELVLFRVVQGLGGGMIMPVAQMILAALAGPQRMGRVMSFSPALVLMPALLAPTLGPIVGGLVLTHLSRPWLFFINVPIGVLAVAAGGRCSPHRARRTGAPRPARPGAAWRSRCPCSSTASRRRGPAATSPH